MKLAATGVLALSLIPTAGVHAAQPAPNFSEEYQGGGSTAQYIGHYRLSASQVDDLYRAYNKQTTYYNIFSILIGVSNAAVGAGLALDTNRESQNWDAITRAYYNNQGVVVVIYASSTSYNGSTDVYMSPS